MKIYEVVVIETIEHAYQVEAKSAQEAADTLRKRLNLDMPAYEATRLEAVAL